MARKIIVPPDYQVDLDRLPPRPGAGCSGPVVMIFAFLFVVVGGGVGVGAGAGLATEARVSPPPTAEAVATEEPAATEEITVTLDSWDMTGTALVLSSPSATIDYCWWATPTSTPTSTLEFTPDSWAVTGTALYEATFPPQTPTNTPDIPRAWCNNPPPTATPTQTATGTPTDTPPPTVTATGTRAQLATVGYSGGGGGIYPPTVPPGYSILPTVSLIDLPTIAGTLTPTLTLTPSNIPSHLDSRKP